MKNKAIKPKVKYRVVISNLFAQIYVILSKRLHFNYSFPYSMFELSNRDAQLKSFDRLLTIMDELREKCPWDRKQTIESLRHLTIEETYELGDAILDNDLEEVKKELGDVLLHIVFYAKIGSETKDFDIADVCNTICDKLIARHPHI